MNTTENTPANILPTAEELAMLAEIRAKQAEAAAAKAAERKAKLDSEIEKEMKLIAKEGNIYSGLQDFGFKIYNELKKFNPNYVLSHVETERKHEVSYYIDRTEPGFDSGDYMKNKRVYWSQPNTYLIPQITIQGAGRTFEVRFGWEQQRYGNGVDFYCTVSGLEYPDCDRRRKAAASINEKISTKISQMERAANVKQVREDGVKFLKEWAACEYTNSTKVELWESREEAPYVMIHFANNFRIKYGFMKTENGFTPRLIGAVTVAMNQQDLIDLFIK